MILYQTEEKKKESKDSISPKNLEAHLISNLVPKPPQSHPYLDDIN